MSIVVENLTKKYDQQRAVDDISFTIRTGEVVGFLGPNGAGKTTTMKIITSFMAPTEGNVKVCDISIYDDPDLLRKKIGYLPESNPLYQEMPVIDYLRYTAELQGVPKESVPERIKEMIRVCGLNAEKHKRIGELSKGYRQRVGLAQAMIHDPEILVLDEPTSGLDPNQIVEIRKLIRELGKEKTVILSTHILPEVEATCDRILIINKGKIVADGTSETLRRSTKAGEVLKVRISGCNDKDEGFMVLQALDEVAMVNPAPMEKNDFTYIVEGEENVDVRKALFLLCCKRGWILKEMSPIETKLEDIFRDLTLE